MKWTQEKKFALLRIVFGVVWGIDAAFKWMPAFVNGLPGMIGSMTSGQPSWVADWLNFWLGIINIAPHFFAVLIAVIESALAVGLAFNLFPRAVYISGFAFSLAIWSVGESFGGPYAAGSTDIGAAIIYSFVFAALYFYRFGSVEGKGQGAN